MQNANDDRISVAAVCGSEVRIYGELPKGVSARPYLRSLQFPHHGAAKLYAEEYEDSQRGKQ